MISRFGTLNADPYTGHTVFYTNANGFAVRPRYGGTSFVAPQLAGVTVLPAQNDGRRLGLLNPLHYGLALLGGTQGSSTISAGDNWFYSGRNGYSPAAGLGTLNVANLAKWIKQLAPSALLPAQGQN